MAVLLLPLAWLAALGFISIAAVQVASIAGLTPPGGQAVFLLHVAACPRWMRIAAAGLVAYVAFNFIQFMTAVGGRSAGTRG